MSETTAVYLAPTQNFDYNELDAETRISLKARAERVGERTRRIASDIWENGREFHEAQQELANYGNGRFLAWVESETGYGKSTVYRMIDVYQRFDFPKLGKMDIATSALYLLASPSVPEEARNEVIEAAGHGQPITYTNAKEVIAKHEEKRRVAQYEFTVAVRGWIERYGGNRENWLTVARNMWKNQHDAYLAEIEKNHLSQYNYTPDMLKTALSTIIADEELFQKRTLDQQVYAWLSAYNDRDGRTWRDLSDNQIHHANSPCYQKYIEEFPNLTDPKLHLKRALAQLKREAEEARIQKANDEFFEKLAQKDDEYREAVADQNGRKPPRRCPRCHANRSAKLVGDDCWKCRNCGRKYDHTGKLPPSAYKPIVEQVLDEVQAYEEEETAVATTPTKYLNTAELEQTIMRWGIGQRTNDIPGQLELMQAIQQQKVNHPLWPEMVASIKGPYRAEDLATAVANWLQYLEERVRELETGEPTTPHMPIWKLQRHLVRWLADFYGNDLYLQAKAAALLKTGGQECKLWAILETHVLIPTREPYRISDLTIVINKVAEYTLQSLAAQNASAAALLNTEESAIWQLRHLLDDFDTRLVRFKMLYPDVEQINLSVAALRSAINLVGREAKRTLRSSDEEEE